MYNSQGQRSEYISMCQMTVVNFTRNPYSGHLSKYQHTIASCFVVLAAWLSSCLWVKLAELCTYSLLFIRTIYLFKLSHYYDVTSVPWDLKYRQLDSLLNSVFKLTTREFHTPHYWPPWGKTVGKLWNPSRTRPESQKARPYDAVNRFWLYIDDV